MRRRILLTSIGSSVALATTGCLGAAAPGDGGDVPTDDSTTDLPTTRDRPGPTEESPGAVSQPRDGIETPDPLTAFERDVLAAPCPVVDDRADIRSCSTGTDPDEVPVVFAPDRTVFAPTAGDDSIETLSISLENRSAGQFGFNPYAWSLHRREGDEWVRLGPDVHPEPWTTLEAGEAFTYDLALESPAAESSRENFLLVREDLDDGIYALAVSGQLSGTGAKDSQRVACVAVFGVEFGGE